MESNIEQNNREKIISIGKDVEALISSSADIKRNQEKESDANDRRWQRIEQSIQKIDPIIEKLKDLALQYTSRFQDTDTRLKDLENDFEQRKGELRLMKIIGAVGGAILVLLNLYNILIQKS